MRPGQYFFRRKPEDQETSVLLQFDVERDMVRVRVSISRAAVVFFLGASDLDTLQKIITIILCNGKRG
jgi:hypothetical protein